MGRVDPSELRTIQYAANVMRFVPQMGMVESPGAFAIITAGNRIPVAQLINGAQRRWIVSWIHREQWTAGKFILDIGWSTSGTSTSAMSYQIALYGVPEAAGAGSLIYFKGTTSLTPTGTALDWQTLSLESDSIDAEYRSYILQVSRVPSANADNFYLADITVEYVLEE